MFDAEELGITLFKPLTLVSLAVAKQLVVKDHPGDGVDFFLAGAVHGKYLLSGPKLILMLYRHPNIIRSMMWTLWP